MTCAIFKCYDNICTVRRKVNKMAKSAMKSAWENKRKEDERLQKVQKKNPAATIKEASTEAKEEDNKKE